MTYKLGKAPARRKPTDLHYLSYRSGAAFELPKVFGHERLESNWQMLGNDRYGDCVLAGAAHETMLWNLEAGRSIGFNDEVVLSDYGAITGFTPTDPSTDQGTDVHDALDYRRHTGIEDVNGQRHLIGGYVSITPGHYEHVLEATYLFSAVGIGFEFPTYAMSEFDSGKPWALKRGRPNIDGGHYVPVVGRDNRGHLLVVTWGRVQAMTKGFFERFCDEAYGILSPEMIGGSGKSLEGFDLTQLQEDLASLS